MEPRGSMEQSGKRFCKKIDWNDKVVRINEAVVVYEAGGAEKLVYQEVDKP